MSLDVSQTIELSMLCVRSLTPAERCRHACATTGPQRTAARPWLCLEGPRSCTAGAVCIPRVCASFSGTFSSSFSCPARGPQSGHAGRMRSEANRWEGILKKSSHILYMYINRCTDIESMLSSRQLNIKKPQEKNIFNHLHKCKPRCMCLKVCLILQNWKWK